MTNSTFTNLKVNFSLLTSRIFARVTWVFLMVFAFGAFKANAAITVASTPDAINYYCYSSPQLVLPVVSTSNCAGGGGLQYQWYRGGSSFGASSAIITGGAPNFSGYSTSTMIVGSPSALALADTFWVSITETSGGCSAVEIRGPFIYQKITSLPVVSLTPSTPYEVCELDTASFTATHVSPTPYGLLTFDWYKKPFSGSFGLVQHDTTSLTTTNSYYYIPALSNDQDSVRVSVTNACGTLDTFGVLVNVNPKPIATVNTSNIGVCQGDAFTVTYTVSNAALSANRGSTAVNWSASITGDAALVSLLTASGSGNGAVNSNIPGGSLSPGTYTATISTITNTSSTPNCPRTLINQTITVIVYPEPNASFTQDTVKLCYQQVSNPSLNMVVSNATYTNGGTVAVNWSVYYRQVSENVTSSCASTANANLTRSAGTHLNALSGTVTGTGNQNYVYTIPSSLQPGVYRYYIDSIVNTSNGCSTTIPVNDSIVIVVDPSPTITVSPTATSICQTNTTNFNVIAANAQYCNSGSLTNATWSLTFTDATNSTIGASPFAGVGNGANVFTTSAALAAGVYTFTPGTITNTTAGQQACSRVISGNTFTLTVKPAPVVAWSTTAISVCQGSADTFTMDVSNSVLSSVAQNWSVSISESSGNVNTANCSGSTAGIISPLTQTGTGNLSRQFIIPPTLPAGIYTYTLNSITNTTGSCPGTISGGATITITVNPKPQVTINPDSKEVCENNGESFNLTVTNAKYCSALGVPPVNGTWTLSTTDNVDANEYTSIYGAVGYGTGNFSTVVSVDTAALLTPNNHTFIATATMTTPAVCVGNSDTFTVIVEPRPFVTFSTDTVNVCFGSTSSFSVNITNALQNGVDQSWAFTYTRNSGALSGVNCTSVSTDLIGGSLIGGFWTVTGSTGDSVLTVNINSILPVGTYRYTLTGITNTSGPCTGFIGADTTIVVNVLPVPSFALSPDTAQVCEGDSVDVNFTVSNALYCTSPTTSAPIDWALYYTDNSNSNAPTPIITGSGNSTFSYKSNSLGTLPVGYYQFRGDSIKATNIVPQCANTTPDSVIVVVNPEPSITFDQDTVTLSVGYLDSFSFTVSNAMLAGNPQNWTVNYQEISAFHSASCIVSSGANQNMIGGTGTNPSLNYSGSGNGTTTFYVPTTTPAGVYTYVFNSITNTSANPDCSGSFGLLDTVVIRVLPQPYITFSDLSDTICEGNTDSFLLQTHATYCVYPNAIGDMDLVFEINDSINNLTYSPALTLQTNTPFSEWSTGLTLISGNQTFQVDVNVPSTLTTGVYTFETPYIFTYGPGAPWPLANDSIMTLSYTLTVMPNPDVKFVQSYYALCEGETDSVYVQVTNAVLPVADSVNWQVWTTEVSGNILTSCAQSTIANRTVVPTTFTGKGDGFIGFVIPDTLSPGVYTYTLDSIKNLDYTPNCGGTVSAFSTVTVYIFPKPEVSVNPDTSRVCEGDNTPFTLDVINAQYCTAVGSASTNAPWVLHYTDATQSNIFPDPLTGSGTSSYTFTANNGGSLGAGYYNFTVDSVQINIVVPVVNSCIDYNVKDTFTLVVNPEPVVAFQQSLIEMCEGDTNTFFFEVTNATLGGSDVNWTVSSVNAQSTVAMSCATSAIPSPLLPVTYNGSGNDTIAIGIPTTLAPGVYRYVLLGVVNTSALPSSCTGTTGSLDTFIVKVYPKPNADFVETALTLCENERDSITLNVTSAQFCPSIGGVMTDFNWSLAFTDNVNSSMGASPLLGLGNFTSKYAVNDLFALSSGGSSNGVYKINLNSITNTTHSCNKTLADSVVVTIENLPELTITSWPSDVCKGDVATIGFRVDSVLTGQNWSFNYQLNGGGNVAVSGTDTGNFTFTTVALNTVGINTISYDSIQNTTTGCWGNEPVNTTINVLELPDVDSFVYASSPYICSGDSNLYTVQVKHSGGKTWKITYELRGDTMDNWTGTGNGIFNFYTPAQWHVDTLGVDDTAYLVIQKIEWVSPTTPPLCVNNAVTTDSAMIIVRPMPHLQLLSDTSVCINTPATITYRVNGVAAGQNYTFDWTLTNPTNGPNTINGSGPSTSIGTFVTPNLFPAGTSTVSVLLLQNTTTGCDSTVNVNHNITVDPPSEAGTLSQSYDICENDPGPFGLKLTGYVGNIQHWDSSNTLSYIWHNIGHVMEDSITVVFPQQTSTYRVIVKSGACPADSSNDVIIFVNPLPGATIVSANDSICEGSNINLVVNVTGVPNSQDWSIVYSNTNPSTMTPDTLQGTGSGNFSFTLSGAGSGFSAPSSTIKLERIINHFKGCDSTLTDSIVVVVKSAPVGGTVTPDTTTLCTNSNGSVTWVPGNGSVAYWQSSSTGLPGSWTTIPSSTANSYNFTNITATTYYRAVIVNSPCAGADTSAVAVVNVITAPNVGAGFVNLPSNNKFCASTTNTTSFTYEVTGTYGNSWKLYILEDDSVHIVTGTGDKTVAGANALTFTTSTGKMIESFDVTLMYMYVYLGSDSCIKNLSNNATATVRVIDMPVATLNSVTSPICNGTNVSFTFTVSNILSTESWKLAYTVNGAADTTTGTGPGTFSRTSIHTGTNTSTTVSNVTHTIALASIENTTTVNSSSSTCINPLSSSLTYVVYSPTIAGTVSHGMAIDTVCIGANGVVTATASSNSSAITHWESRTWDGAAWSSWTSIANTTSTQGYFTITNMTQFRAVYQNGPCASATSNSATIVPKALPTVAISLPAGSDTICSGATSTFNVTVANVNYGQNFSLTYVEGTSLKTAPLTQNLSGVHTITTGTLTNNTTISLQGITVTSGTPQCVNGSLNGSVSIIVQPNPMATIASAPSRLCQGSTVTFSVTVTGVNTGDNWTMNYSLDGTPQTAATGTGSGTFTFTTGSTVTAHSDILLLTNITNNSTQDLCMTSLTDSRTITVDTITVAGTIGYDTTVCRGGSGFVMETVASPSGASIVKWQSKVVGGSSWTDINNTSTTINFYNLNDTTEFRAVYQNGLCATAISNSIIATPRALPTAVITSTNDTICSGAATSFTVLIGNVAAGQSWTLNTVIGSAVYVYNGTGGGSHTLTIGAGWLTSTTDISLQSISTSSFVVTTPSYVTLPACFNGSLNSTQTITVQNNPIATLSNYPLALCHGSTVTFTTVVSNIATTDTFELIYSLDAVLDTVYGVGPGSHQYTTAYTVTSTSDLLKLESIKNLSTQDECMTVLSDSRTISVDPITVAGVIGHDTTVCKGGSGFMIQTAPGVGSIVKWQSRVLGASGWTDINNPSISINFYNLNDTTEFRAIYKSGLCSEEPSLARTAMPRELPYVVITSTDDTICAGKSTTFTVNVTNVNAGQSFSMIYVVGSTTRTYLGTGGGSHTITIPAGLFTSTTDITLQSISTSVDLSTSPRTPACSNTNLNSTQTITVQMNPTATLTTVPSRLCHGSTVTFTLNVSSVNTGDSWTIWYNLDGTAQTPATGTGPGNFTFTTGSVVSAPSDILRLDSIRNNSTQDMCITTLSDSRTITVDSTTVAGVIGHDTTVCKGGSGLMVQTAPGVGSIIKWQSRVKGNTAWTDINNTSTTLNFYNLNDTTEFRAIYQNGLCLEAPSNIKTATPRELPYAVITSSDDTICAGKSTTFTVNVTNVNAGQSFTLTYVVGSTVRTLTATGPGSHTVTIPAGLFTNTTDITLQSNEPNSYPDHST